MIFTGIVHLVDWFEYQDVFLIVIEKPEGFICLFEYPHQYGAMPENCAKKVFKSVSLFAQFLQTQFQFFLN